MRKTWGIEIMMGFEAQSMESLGNGRLLAREVLDK